MSESDTTTSPNYSDTAQDDVPSPPNNIETEAVTPEQNNDAKTTSVTTDTPENVSMTDKLFRHLSSPFINPQVHAPPPFVIRHLNRPTPRAYWEVDTLLGVLAWRIISFAAATFPSNTANSTLLRTSVALLVNDMATRVKANMLQLLHALTSSMTDRAAGMSRVGFEATDVELRARVYAVPLTAVQVDNDVGALPYTSHLGNWLEGLAWLQYGKGFLPIIYPGRLSIRDVETFLVDKIPGVLFGCTRMHGMNKSQAAEASSTFKMRIVSALQEAVAAWRAPDGVKAAIMNAYGVLSEDEPLGAEASSTMFLDYMNNKSNLFTWSSGSAGSSGSPESSESSASPGSSDVPADIYYDFVRRLVNDAEITFRRQRYL